MPLNQRTHKENVVLLHIGHYNQPFSNQWIISILAMIEEKFFSKKVLQSSPNFISKHL